MEFERLTRSPDIPWIPPALVTGKDKRQLRRRVTIGRRVRISWSNPFQHYKAKRVGMSRVSGVVRAFRLPPFLFWVDREMDIPREPCMDLGHMDAVGQGQCGGIDTRAADDHDFLPAMPMVKRLAESFDDNAPSAQVLRVAAHHDVFPPRQRAAYGLVGLAAHDDGFTQGDLAEALQVSW